MDFSIRKFPIRDTERLVKVPVRDLKPFTLLRGPAYVLLRRNERYLGVRGPLDFFTAEDIERLQSFTVVYFTPFVEIADPYEQAGRAIRRILMWLDEASAHPVDPFERSDAVVRILGPLWSADLQMEPFFATVLVEELCGSLPAELLLRVRNEDVAQFERRLLEASGVVLLLLLLGEGDLGHLRRCRQEIFEGAKPAHRWAAEALRLVSTPGRAHPLKAWKWSDWDPRDPLVHRLQSRMNRISLKLAKPYLELPTVFGAKGFLSG